MNRITVEQARDLASWLGNVQTIIERRAYRGNPQAARQWVGRWIRQLLEYYAASATPEEAVAAVPTAVQLSR